jgi:O-antigen ligase
VPVLVLLLPLLFMHARAAAEVTIALLGLAFLLRCARAGDWSWLRQGWAPLGAAWWMWLVLCSLPGIGIGGWHSFVQALAAVRFLLLVVALEHWLLREAVWCRRLQAMLTAVALYIGLSSLLQLLAGHNLWGWPRSADGALTGPFGNPRAGAPFSRLLFPALLPPAGRLLARRRPAATLAAAAIAIAGVGIVVLIGQRTPLLLTLLGLLVSGLLLRRLRPVVLVCIIAGGALLAVTPVISPPTWYRLVTKFTYQMNMFPDSDYGLIAARAVVITAQHPLFGRGYDGFRNACPDIRTWEAWPKARLNFWDGGGLAICNIHPHNPYLQAATDAGIPGLALFCALVIAWLRGLLRGIGREPDPLRVGLFVAVLMELWPVASASGFYSTEIMGFMFLMLGFGLACARAAASTSPTSPAGSTPST